MLNKNWTMIHFKFSIDINRIVHVFNSESMFTLKNQRLKINMAFLY